jgi:type 1 glutamine amidotransferase
MTRFGVLARLVIVTSSVCAGACSNGGTGATGTGAAGTGLTTGTAGTGAPGAAGTSGAAGSGGPGTAGAGAAGTGGPGAAATGAAGAGSAAGTSGAAGTGVAGTGAGGTGAAGTGAAGATPDGGGPTDGSTGSPDAVSSRSNKVLLYTKSTGFVHDSTVTAAAEIAKAATAAGLVPETSADPAKFATAAALAEYGGVVLIATAGEPLGSPGTAQIKILIDWVHAGGGLVAIENANHSYDNNMDYVNLMGGDFNGHSGLGPDYCYKEGDNPSVVKLPATIQVTDEIYYFTKFRMDNVVVLRCASDRRPISWVRQEGAGRFFYTALGHTKELWTNPPLVSGHVLPALLWTMGRPVP